MPSRTSTGSVSQYTPRTRYRSSAAWSPSDDIQLLNARAQGLTWATISEQYFPSKGDNACRKHHERLVKRQSEEKWDQEKLQAFAAEYWDKRKDLWMPLANSLNLKWQFVEEKCFEFGFARLKSAAEAHNRVHRRVSGTEDDLSDEADSGIAMDDETEMGIGRRTTGPPPTFAGAGRGGASSHGARLAATTPQSTGDTFTSPQQSPQFTYAPGPPPSYPCSGVESYSSANIARTLPPLTANSNRRTSHRHSIASLLSPIPDA